MIELNKIYNEDCLTTLKRMDDNSIDCVVTSPPYYALRKYTDSDFEIGREHTPSEYIDNLVEVFTEVYRVLKPTGTVWVNIGDTYNGNKIGNDNAKWTNVNTKDFKKEKWNGCKNKDLIGIPFMLAFALRDRVGFYLRNDIIWHRPNQMPESVTDRCVKSHEYIFFLTKNEKYYFDYQAIQEPAKTFENRPFGVVRQREFDYDTKQSREPEKYLISTGIKFGGNKYGDNDDNHFQTYSGKEWKPQMKNLHRDDNRWDEDRVGCQLLLSIYDYSLHPEWHDRMPTEQQDFVGIEIHVDVSRVIDERMEFTTTWVDDMTIEEMECMADSFYRWVCTAYPEPRKNTQS